MAEYYSEAQNTVERDELFAGTDIPVRLENVSVAGGEKFSRGCILAGVSGIFASTTNTQDAAKVLVIASEDYEAAGASEVGVTSVYTSGNFHTERLSTGSSVVGAADFKEPLRQVGIFETSMHEIF